MYFPPELQNWVADLEESTAVRGFGDVGFST